MRKYRSIMRLVALLLIPCLAVPQAMSAGGKPFTASYTWSAACPSFNDQALACNPVLSSRNLLDGVRKIVRRRVTRQLISAGQAQLVQPVVAVFDVHGTLLQPNWKDSQILAYQKLTGADDGAARAWVDANTLNLSNDELIRRMADASGKPEAEARRWFNWAREHIERNFIPEPIPGALDLIKTLHDRGVPIVILSGGAHATVVRQLSKGGFLKYIPENRILGRDDVMRSVLGEPYSVEHRKNALRSIARQFPGHRLLSFDDWTDNIETVNELGGTTIAIPQGEGEDRRTNETILREKGAQFFVSDWREAAARLGEWGVPDHQPPEQRIPTLLKPVEEIPVILSTLRPHALPLHMEMSDDLKTLTYSRVIDEKNLIRPDGSLNYGALRTIATFPSHYLMSPRRSMQREIRFWPRMMINRLWPKKRRYSTYRGITTSWDGDVDLGVWAGNIDTYFMHRGVEDTGILSHGNIQVAGELGTGGGHGSVLLASRIPSLKEIWITDILLYALQTAARGIVPLLKPGAKLRTYWGQGIRGVQGNADIILVNPPYIPSYPGDPAAHDDPYRGTGLIREVLEIGIEKLNPRNPDASIFINVSSLGIKDFERYRAEFGDRYIIEEIGEPLEVPLKIAAINRNREWTQWLIDECGLIFKPDADRFTEPYYHSLHLFRIRPKDGVAKTPEIERKDEVESRIYQDTAAMVETFQPLLSGPVDGDLEEMFPEIQAYLTQDADTMNFDSQAAPAGAGRNRAIPGHIIERGFGRKLLGLETRDYGLFQEGEGLSREEFWRLADSVARLAASRVLPHMRAAFLYHDVSKAVPADWNREWSDIPGIDFQIPNKASALILRNLKTQASFRPGLFENIDLFIHDPRHELLNEFFYRVIETRGIPGQWVRGEVSEDLAAEFTGWIQENFAALGEAFGAGSDSARTAERLTDAIRVFNALDVASLREGLLTSRMNAELECFYRDFQRVITPDGEMFPVSWDGIQKERWEGLSTDASRRTYLKGRFGRFRRERREFGEPAEYMDRIIDSLSPEAAEALTNELAHFQGWYVESATFGLRADSQVKLVALAIALARRKGLDTSKTYHINFFRFMKNLSSGRHQFDPYKTRMVESVLRRMSLDDLLTGRMDLSRFDLDCAPEGAVPLLGAIEIEMDGLRAISFDFRFSEHAGHLLALLHDYELTSCVFFHDILTRLLNVYGIAKDAFDRVSNEFRYTGNMNAAMDDKARLQAHGRGPVVVDVGAGMATLETWERLKQAEGIARIVAIDTSEEIIESLRHGVRQKQLSAEVIQGDANDIAAILRRLEISFADTIMYSSILHEVFSSLGPDAARTLMRASLTALAPGGRLLIRDGMMPEDGETEQILELTGIHNKEAFDYFIANFTHRKVSWTAVEEHPAEERWKVRLKRKDAAEFLFKLTWCYTPEFNPAGLPYEIREQYLQMTRREYVDFLKEVAWGEGLTISEVDIPASEREYLQQGYIDNLKGKARLLNLDGTEAPLPNSNGMIVMERWPDQPGAPHPPHAVRSAS